VILNAEKELTGNMEKSNLDAAIYKLDYNIDTLRLGGTVADQEIKPLSEGYLRDWQLVDQRRIELKDLINNEIESHTPPVRNSSRMINVIELAGSNLISASDNLVRNLSNGSKEESESLIQLEVSLLVVNVAVHILMLCLIARIIRPIISITKATEQIKTGNLNVTIEPGKGGGEVSTLSTSFKEMIDNLKKYDHMQDNFINIAAHELRTPVQPLIGVADMLAINLGESDKIEITKDELEMIIRNAARLDQLSFKILEASLIDASRLVLRKEIVDLKGIITATVGDATRFLPRDSKLNITVKQPEEPIFLVADKQRLSDVIAILVANAIKFTGAGTITVSMETVADNAVIRVKDTGNGIDPEIMPRLFTRFSAKPGSGTGLGLYIAKGIVEAHGGKIWAENNKDETGASFTFSLPLSIPKSTNSLEESITAIKSVTKPE